MLADQATRARGGWLTAFLVYLALSNVWWAFRSADAYRDLVAHADPRAPHWPFLALAVLAALNVVAVAGLWCWRRWGVLLLGGGAVAAFGVTLVLQAPAWTSLGLGVISFGILVALARPKWSQFR